MTSRETIGEAFDVTTFPWFGRHLVNRLVERDNHAASAVLGQIFGAAASPIESERRRGRDLLRHLLESSSSARVVKRIRAWAIEHTSELHDRESAILLLALRRMPLREGEAVSGFSICGPGFNVFDKACRPEDSEFLLSVAGSAGGLQSALRQLPKSPESLRLIARISRGAFRAEWDDDDLLRDACGLAGEGQSAVLCAEWVERDRELARTVSRSTVHIPTSSVVVLGGSRTQGRCRVDLGHGGRGDRGGGM